MNWTMLAVLGLGGILCCVNFYHSVLRYPIHRIRGGARDDYRWVSGIPLFGSLLVAVSLVEFWREPWLLWVAVALIVIDTGGLHWFAGTMVYQYFRKPQVAVEQDAAADADKPRR